MCGCSPRLMLQTTSFSFVKNSLLSQIVSPCATTWTCKMFRARVLVNYKWKSCSKLVQEWKVIKICARRWCNREEIEENCAEIKQICICFQSKRKEKNILCIYTYISGFLENKFTLWRLGFVTQISHNLDYYFYSHQHSSSQTAMLLKVSDFCSKPFPYR